MRNSEFNTLLKWSMLEQLRRGTEAAKVAQRTYAPAVEIDDSRTTKVMRRRDWKLVMAEKQEK